jgi:hypothetical protein
MTQRYAVPEDGLKAISVVFDEFLDKLEDADPFLKSTIEREEFKRKTAEALIRWQSENPQVPTWEQKKALRCHLHPAESKGNGAWMGTTDIEDGAVEWQRRMYLAPEPEVPKDANRFGAFNPEERSILLVLLQERANAVSQIASGEHRVSAYLLAIERLEAEAQG